MTKSKYYSAPTVSWKFILNLGAISRSYDLKTKQTRNQKTLKKKKAAVQRVIIIWQLVPDQIHNKKLRILV